ncbi:MAG: ATP-binding protein [Sphaerochaeta sp.]|jgi:DNA replication protein DnaC|nr:ATP-binding protein [Sphaerochaeta sp.]
MIGDESIRKLRELNLSEMVEILQRQEHDVAYTCMPFDERIQYITDYVYKVKQDSKIKRLIRSARLRYPNAELNSVHYDKRGLDKRLLMELGTCAFIECNHNVVFNGFTGAGKSWLACAIGKQACKSGYKVRYYRMPTLLEDFYLQEVRIGGRRKLVRRLQHYDLLIIDEWMSSNLDDKQVSFMFELIESRYQNKSTVFCTQFAPAEWLPRLGGGPQADAITDRIIHESVFFSSGDLNMREVMGMKDKTGSKGTA